MDLPEPEQFRKTDGSMSKWAKLRKAASSNDNTLPQKRLTVAVSRKIKKWSSLIESENEEESEKQKESVEGAKDDESLVDSEGKKVAPANKLSFADYMRLRSKSNASFHPTEQ